MRRRGWGGDPPASDDEARARILDAAAWVVRQHGPDADIVLVSERLGVTRQTIYRYFADRSDLFGQVAVLAVNEFVDALLLHLAAWDDPLERLVRAIVFGVRQLPRDPRLAVLVKPEVAGQLLMSTDAIEGMRASVVAAGLGPALPSESSAHLGRLVHAVFVTVLLVGAPETDDELLAYLRFAFRSFYD